VPMKSKLSTFFSSSFFTVSVFTSASTVIKLITSFLSAKVIALYAGPAGLGMLGQLSSFIAVSLTLSTGAINNGIIKYLAEYKGDETKQYQLLHAALKLTAIGSFLASIASIVFSGWWSFWLFGHTEYAFVFVVLGSTLFCHSAYTLFSSVLNGLSEYKKFNQLAVVASITGLITTYLFIRTYGITGGLLSLALYQVFVFVAVFLFYKSLGKIEWRKIWKTQTTPSHYKKLLAFSVMALVTSVITPLLQIVIRTILKSEAGVYDVGYYEGAIRISQLYLLVITTTLSVYYLPKLSAIQNDTHLRKEILNGYALILPATALILLCVFVCRTWIIDIAFSEKFQPMTSYFLPQLIGDFFKIASWLLAFIMIARAKTYLYILTELVYGVILLLFVYVCVEQLGAVGAVYAYAIAYISYFVMMLVVFRQLIFAKA
jgi:O-antigen/teichoic acid export membrane protein